MSKNEVKVNTGNTLFVNTDLGKVFIWENRYENDNYINNSSYDPIALVAGTVMGRVATTNKLAPCQSNASDGSQYPCGILAQDISLAEGETKQVSICTYGDVATEKVIFVKPGDGLNTVVSSRTYRDRIKADTAGVRLVDTDEMTDFDNS